MVAVMDQVTLDIEMKNISSNFSVDQVSIQQLIDLAIDSTGDHIGLETKKELLNRGKDNIHTRIQIKKACKNAISHIEAILKELNCELNSDKAVLKSYKNRFLTAVSVLDTLQLAWQKYDLSLKH